MDLKDAQWQGDGQADGNTGKPHFVTGDVNSPVSATNARPLGGRPEAR